MNTKKLTAVILTSILLLSLSACGNSGGDKAIPLSKLEFGMTEEQVINAIGAEPDDTSEVSVYMLSSDVFDKRLNRCSFRYVTDKLYGVSLDSDRIPESDAVSLRNDILKQVEDVYGFSEDDWNYYDVGGFEWYYTHTHVTETEIFYIDVPVFEYDEPDGTYEVSLKIMYDYPRDFKFFETNPIIPKN